MVEMRTVHVDDLADPKLYGATDYVRTQSVALEGVRTAFYVPLILEGRSIGALLLYRRIVSPFFEDDIVLVETFAEQAVIAIENVRQFKELEARNKEVQALNAGLELRVEEQVAEIERVGRLRRFLSPAVADAVISAGEDGLLRSHRALIGTLFADIRGFTAFCESAEPEETIDVLQTYHEAMGKLLHEHGAGMDQRAGDGIMAIFNDPLPCQHPAGDAVRLALAMRARMVELCGNWKRHGHRLGFGVGISMGYATVGMVGSEGRYDYTASGTAVNLAARLCDEAVDGEILISPRAFAAVEGEFDIIYRGELALKGIHAPVEVHKVVAAQSF
jgi:class 3 adenylate cyclase